MYNENIGLRNTHSLRTTLSSTYKCIPGPAINRLHEYVSSFNSHNNFSHCQSMWQLAAALSGAAEFILPLMATTCRDAQGRHLPWSVRCIVAVACLQGLASLKLRHYTEFA